MKHLPTSDDAFLRMLCNAELTIGEAAWPVGIPTSILIAPVLTVAHHRMVKLGAWIPRDADECKSPVFKSLLSTEAYRFLTREPPFHFISFLREKDDDENPLAPFGGIMVINGFCFIINDRMPRYDLINNLWVKREPDDEHWDFALYEDFIGISPEMGKSGCAIRFRRSPSFS